MITATADFAPPLRDRSRGRPPPLSAWLAAVAIVVVVTGAALATFLSGVVPVAPRSDSEFYEAQLAQLDRQIESRRKAGERPMSIVFIGTSRMKNVVFEPEQVARAAQSAGVERPVASTFLAINWGGFDRLRPALAMLDRKRPDVIVMMPEFFVEDFNALARARLGYRFIQTQLWGGDELTLFGTREFEEAACSGFDRPPEQRLAEHQAWIKDSSNSPGPALARQAVQDFTRQDTLVIVADVPVSRQLAAARSPVSESAFIERSGVADSGRVRVRWLGQPLPDAAYCDWSHIDPDRAGLWQRAFFSRVAADLNRLAT